MSQLSRACCQCGLWLASSHQPWRSWANDKSPPSHDAAARAACGARESDELMSPLKNDELRFSVKGGTELRRNLRGSEGTRKDRAGVAGIRAVACDMDLSHY